MTAQAPTLRSSEYRQSIIASIVLGVVMLVLPFVLFRPNTAVVVLSSGLYQGMLFFLVAAGMSIVFGLLDVLNFAQGSFFMLGAYAGFSTFGMLMGFGMPPLVSFIGAFIAAILVGATLGALVEVALLRPLYKRPVFQIVLTFGLAITITEIIRSIYGPAGNAPIDPPGFLDDTVSLMGGQFEIYRLFIIVVGALLMAGITILLRKTRLGIVIRAGVQDSEMVQALGINVRRVFTLVFVLGTAVAALAGMTASPLLGAFPTMGDQFLLTAVIVIVIGGMSSFEGSAVAGLLLGMARAIAESLSVQYFNTPILASVSLLVFMVIVLLVRPNGLFGRE